jgi:hypothetical protein
LQVDSCDVKGVAVELMINGSSLDTQMFVHVGSKIARTYSPRWNLLRYLSN